MDAAKALSQYTASTSASAIQAKGRTVPKNGTIRTPSGIPSAPKEYTIWQLSALKYFFQGPLT